MAVNPDAGKPDQGRPVTGSTGSSSVPGPPPPPPAPPKKGKGTPSETATLALLVRDKRFKPYVKYLGAIRQYAANKDVDPVDLLLAIAVTGRRVLNQQTIASIGNSLSGYVSLDAWIRGAGINPIFDPIAVRNALTKKAGYTDVYVPSPPTTVAQDVKKGVKTAQVKADLTDPYVKLNKDGTIGKTTNPNEAVKSFEAFPGLKGFGTPIRVSDYQRAASHYNDYYKKYIGRTASAKEVFAIVKRGMSDTAVQLMLSKDPAFKRGAIWQAQAPAVLGLAKSIMGENWKSDPDFIRKAIVNNWSDGTIHAKLKARPEYLQGPEYKQTVAGLQNVYSSIQGRPDEAAMQGIKEAALGGWSSDQYAAYLRNQPQYTQSQEYKSKALSFLDALGLITGQQTTQQGISTLGQPTPVPGVDTTTPHSDRLSPTSPTLVQQAAGKSTPKGPKVVAGKTKYPAGYRPF